jgi:hypothetical protein
MVEQILSVGASLQPLGDPFLAEILDTLNGSVLPRDRNQSWQNICYMCKDPAETNRGWGWPACPIPISGYAPGSQLNDGPNTIITPTGFHQLETTAETGYNCISFR